MSCCWISLDPGICLVVLALPSTNCLLATPYGCRLMVLGGWCPRGRRVLPLILHAHVSDGYIIDVVEGCAWAIGDA
jgi:hypothetical protein